MTGSGELGVCVRASYYSDQGYVTALRRKVLSDAGSGKKSSWNKKEKDSDFVFLNVSFESIWKNCSLTVFPPLAWILPGFMNISSVRSPLNHSYQELFDSWRSYLWVGEDENKKEVCSCPEWEWLTLYCWKLRRKCFSNAATDRSDIQGPTSTTSCSVSERNRFGGKSHRALCFSTFMYVQRLADGQVVEGQQAAGGSPTMSGLHKKTKMVMAPSIFHHLYIFLHHSRGRMSRVAEISLSWASTFKSRGSRKSKIWLH